VLVQELAAAGWTTALRERVRELVRSGECASYGEVMRKVLGDVRVVEGGVGRGVEEGVGGLKEGDGVGGSGGLVVPERVVREGVKVIRKELERVATVVVDD
jgi:hypothetical protein